MVSLRPRIHNVIAACLLIVTIGGHWAVLQSVAWMGMLVSYSQAETFSVAVEKTFDGKNPCRLCKTVKEGKSAEQKKSFVKAEIKIDWMLAEQSELIWSPNLSLLPPAGDELNLLVFASPPSPPPQSA